MVLSNNLLSQIFNIFKENMVFVRSFWNILIFPVFFTLKAGRSPSLTPRLVNITANYRRSDK